MSREPDTKWVLKDGMAAGARVSLRDDEAADSITVKP